MDLRDALHSSPLLFPLNWDGSGQAIQVVRLDEQQYAAASFLDHRLLESGMRAALIPWAEFSPAAEGLQPHCNFIFHISHAGSTLVSRLLGLHPQVFSLREPTILRWLAQGSFIDRLPLFLGTWSRVFRPEQTALIKATSFVSDIGCDLLTLVKPARAALMYVPLKTFLPSLLDGSMQDVTSQLPARKSRLMRYLPGLELPAELSAGEQVALSWLAEMLAIHHVHLQFPQRTLWLDFEWLLANREEGLGQLLHLLNARTELQPLLNSDTWGCYAKRPEVQYDTQFRDQIIRQGAAKHGDEITKGMQWMASIANRVPDAVVLAIGG